MERLLFSNYIYSDVIPVVFPKRLPHAFIYAMNMTKEHVKEYGITERLCLQEGFARRIFQTQTRTLYAYDTYQFNDYAKYESSIFSEPDKAAYRKEILTTSI